ncbi:hypothetical protein EST38_g12062 [Candolleomyces aberdarensis]|uniref:Uncharacterized protein n=1 Tax=Candolleomyces aberdarensis TaxID=2316362 RepID=A0A4Q2D4V9_9AGAR|nr:hypothetical protein EST38_g12062 [Candolleomyces aberdarensis]
MPRQRRRQSTASSDTNTVKDPDHPLYPDYVEHARRVVTGMKVAMNKQKVKTPSAVPVLSPYILRARAIPMLVSPWIHVETILKGGLIEISTIAEEDAGTLQLPEFYEDICAMMPGNFYDMLSYAYGLSPGSTEQFVLWLHESAVSARTDTTGQFKAAARRYLPQFIDGALTEELPSLTDKSARGNAHPDFARALIPHEDRDVFDEDPSKYRAEVDNGVRVNTEESWPSFMFADDISYDPDDPVNGFGTGHVFKRFLNHELVGASGADGVRPNGTRPSKSLSWNITDVTARIAAHITAHAYVSQSGMSEFGPEDGEYSVQGLYDNVVKLLTVDDDWTRETLAQMTRDVPFINHGAKGKSLQPRRDKEGHQRRCPVELVLEKRRAKQQTQNQAQLQQSWGCGTGPFGNRSGATAAHNRALTQGGTSNSASKNTSRAARNVEDSEDNETPQGSIVRRRNRVPPTAHPDREYSDAQFDIGGDDGEYDSQAHQSPFV